MEKRRTATCPHIDELTLKQARHGQPRAQRAVIDCYSRSVYALVGRMMVRHPELVPDLAQEALIKVVRGLPRFDPGGPAKLSTWVLTIATRVCIDVLRCHEENVEERIDGIAAGERDPERAALERDLARKVMRAMADLPSDQRAVLVLRAYHDLDYDEIAQALGIEEGTVKSRLARARAVLRQIIKDGEQ